MAISKSDGNGILKSGVWCIYDTVCLYSTRAKAHISRALPKLGTNKVKFFLKSYSYGKSILYFNLLDGIISFYSTTEQSFFCALSQTSELITYLFSIGI